MTAYATNGNGTDWGISTNWTPAGVPGDGDTASVGDPMTISDNITIGQSAAAGASDAITVDRSAGGILTIAAGYKVTLRGDMLGDPGYGVKTPWLIMEAGSEIEFDASQASSPSSQNYKIYWPATGARWSGIDINGTSGSHCTISSNSGGGNGYITGGGTTQVGNGIAYVEYCDFIDIGTTTLDCWWTYVDDIDDYVFSFANCTFTRCGRLRCVGSMGGIGHLSITNCEWSDTFTASDGNASCLYANGSASTLTTGTQSVTNNVFDRGAAFINPNDVTFTGNYVGGRTNNGGNGAFADCSDNLYLWAINEDQNLGMTFPGDVTDCLFFHSNYTNADNPHAIYSSTTEDMDPVISGCIFQSDYDGACDGDGIGTFVMATGRKVIIRNNLSLPTASNQKFGPMMSAQGNSNTTVEVFHNTCWIQGHRVGETYAGHAGLLNALKSNLTYSPNTSDTSRYHIHDQTSTVTDILAAADGDYNCGYNLLAGSNGGGYHDMDLSSGTLGANDLTEDPDFFDSTRGVPTYDTATSGLGNATGTAWSTSTEYTEGDVVSHAVSGKWGGVSINYRCINTHTSGSTASSADGAPYDATDWRDNWEFQTLYRFREDTSRIASCMSWIKIGFRPQNIALYQAGHDSETIGSEEVLPKIYSAQAGNWSSTSTWTGGVVPGNGYSAVLNHAVTMDQNTTVGHSIAMGNDAITINHGTGTAGKLTIAAGYKLTLRGDITLSATSSTTDTAALVMEAGSEIEFDSSQAADPTNQHYQIKWAAIARRFHIDINGTSGSRCAIYSNASGGNGDINHGITSSGTGRIVGQYCDFTDLGTASRYAIQTTLYNLVSWSLTNCTFTDCGEVKYSGSYPDADQDMIFTNCSFKSGTGTYDLYLSNSNITLTTGTRAITNCVFEGECRFFQMYDTDVTNCVFLNKTTIQNGLNNTFTDCFLAEDSLNSQTIFAIKVVSDTYFLQENTTSAYGWTASEDENTLWDGNIIEPSGPHNNGDDLIQFRTPVPSASVEHTFQNCLFLPTPGSSGEDCPGAFISGTGLGSGLITVHLKHNTYVSGGYATGIKCGETSSGVAGSIGTLKSNIAWNASAAVAEVFKFSRYAGTVQDIVYAEDADYNCGWNTDEGEINGYGTLYTPPTLWSSGTGGTNDIDVDPNFVDYERCLAAWDTSLGGPGTRANAKAELAKLNDSDYNSDYNNADLVAFVKGGFVPRNPQLYLAGHDSATIGAVEGVPICTTAQAGDWSSASTWTDGIVPGNGYGVILNHAVNVDVNTTIGHSLSDAKNGTEGIWAIVWGTNGRLNIEEDITLTVRGNCRAPGNDVAYLTMEQGSTWKFDSSQAATPSATHYKLLMSNVNSGRGRIEINGTVTKPCTVTSETSGGSGYGVFGGQYYSTTTVAGGSCIATYCNFSYLGYSASIGSGVEDGVGIAFRNTYHTADNRNDFSYCTFDNIWGMYLYGGNADSRVRLSHCTFTNSLQVYSCAIGTSYSVDPTQGLVEHCVFDKTFNRPSPGTASYQGFTLQDNVFMDGYLVLSTAELGVFQRNVVHEKTYSTSTSYVYGYDAYKILYIKGASTTTNPHIAGFGSAAYDRDNKISYSVFESVGSTTEGNGDIPGGPCYAGRFNILEYCIGPPTYRRETCDYVMMSYLGSSTSYQKTRHNTFALHGRVGETYAGHIGLMVEGKSNIIWSPTATPGTPVYKFLAIGSAVEDVAPAANLDYNCGHNVSAGDSGNGYHGFQLSSGSHGVNDVDVDPQFTDDTRCVATFDIDGNGSAVGTAWSGSSVSYDVGDIVSVTNPNIYGNITINYRCIQAHESSTGSATFGMPGDSNNTTNWTDYWEWATLHTLRQDTSKIETCRAWIFEGFKPTNVALRQAAHDGGDIGAVVMDATSVITTTITATNFAGNDQVQFTWTEVPPP